MTARRAGAVVVTIMLAVAVAGPWLAPYAPDAWIAAPFQPPSRGLWLGTDDMGQDLWSAWLHGARHSVGIALIAALGATVLGVLIGASAGYRRGRWDFITMRVVDFHLTLPALPLLLVVAFYSGASRTLLIAVLIFSSWARCARELHPLAAALRDADFIVAERAMGAGEGRILVRHVVPVLAPMILAQFARLTQHAVLVESSLSFLGLGDPQWSSWGSTLHYANARAAFLGDAWLWWVLPPGIGIALLTSGFALLGVGRPRGAALGAATMPDGAALEAHAGPLLSVRGVSVEWSGAPVLHDLDLSLSAGEVHGLVGLSGAGKTTLVQTILGLLPQTRSLRGGVWLEGRELLRMPERERRRVRGKEIAWISQAAMQSLNPVRTIGSQMREVARLDGAHGADARVARALEQVGLAPEWLRAYPHELSGGMRQRVVIAMALCRSPRLLLADEPASGLDSERAAEILALIARLCRERRMAVLLIAHDLALIESHCDRVSILEGGRIVESGPPAALLAPARSATTTFSPRRRSAAESTVLTMSSVDFAYSGRSVIRDLDLEVRAGECVGLVGASGAGKTTIARLCMRLLQPARGAVHLLGRDLAALQGRELRAHLRHAHLIFQDPYAALPWHQRVKTIVGEPLRLAGVDRRKQAPAVAAALAGAGLVPPAAWTERLVDTLSGGERQRVALARALIGQPRLIVADEPTSMLDGPMKWAWLERLDALHREYGLAVLLITHDLAQAHAVCDRIVTLQDGRLIEAGAADGLKSLSSSVMMD